MTNFSTLFWHPTTSRPLNGLWCPLILMVAAYAGGCHKKSRPADQAASNVASVRIDEFVPPKDQGIWQTMEVRIDRLPDNTLQLAKTFDRSAFSSGLSTDTKVSVNYGTYKISLVYFKDGKGIYQSCPDELAKTHSINQPEYPVSIAICQTQGGVPSPVGTTEKFVGLSNPFENKSMYVNPSYRQSVIKAAEQTKLKGDPQSLLLSDKMLKLKDTPTALWVDRIEAISLIEPALKDARSQQAASGKPVIVTLIIYNLPERDCAAYASAGELLAANNGLIRYKNEYIAPIKKILSTYSDVATALIIEPDSLPNLATNMGVQKCVTAAPLYREGVAYAIKELNMSHMALYLDTAHGGWLGWPENLTKMARIFKEVLDLAGGPDTIRGFASNVSNYSPVTALSPDPLPDSYYEYNPARDELTFVSLLRAELEKVGIRNKAFVIDTSRNGQALSRKVWGNWCNIKGAGIGQRPRVNPASHVDAYLWLKPPGESDGTTDQTSKRFDIKCRSEDSMANAPEAGRWFQENFEILVAKANPEI